MTDHKFFPIKTFQVRPLQDETHERYIARKGTINVNIVVLILYTDMI